MIEARGDRDAVALFSGGDIMLEQLLNGLTQGSVYALLALGFTIIFGVLRMVTFSHGEVFMIGAYAGYVVFHYLSDSILLALLAAAAITFALGAVIEIVAFRRLRNAPHFSSLLVTIGFGVLLTQIAQFIFGAEVRTIPARQIEGLTYGEIQIGEVYVSYLQMAVLGCAIAIMGAIFLFFRFSRLGTAIRATAQDHEAAMAMGVDVNRIFTLTFAFGSMLGGIAGVLIGFYYNLFYPTMGVMLGLKAFSAAVIGGLASMPGAIIAGLLIGIVEVFSVELVNSSLRHLIAFVFMFVFLLFRPSGLFGGGQLKGTRGD